MRTWSGFLKVVFCILCIIVWSCSVTKTESEASTDSVTAVSDSTYAPQSSLPLRAAEPEASFPDYSNEIFTEDSLEAFITPLLGSLILSYTNLSTEQIIGEYTFTFTNDSEDDQSSTTETHYSLRVWYIDFDHNLRMATKTASTDNTSYSEISLFDAKNLIGLYSDFASDGQVTVINKDRILGVKSPACGVHLDLSDGTMVTAIDSIRVAQKNNAAQYDFVEVLDWLSTATPKSKSEKNYTFEKPNFAGGESFMEELIVPINLFDQYIKPALYKN